jgi:hypothetical protein
MEARVTSHSQSFRLKERMADAKISHGQDVRADLPNVRVLATAGIQEGQVFFCNMGPILVREILIPGDERLVGGDVMLEGLDVPASGMYDLLDARLTSNGEIRVMVDERTRVVPAAAAGVPVELGLF